ncbi:MAG: hypothetical protein OEV78_12945 [Spirochaetia bacterium]|nr:hypothetical protein [Spirochaetia bacterium]
MQESMNFETPLHHSGDPQTSRLAAKKQKETGQLSGDRLNVLIELVKYPLSTGAEIGFGLHDGSKRNCHQMAMMSRKRLGELVKGGYAIARGSRPCSVYSDPASTYEATEAGKRLVRV